jgi:hypothetical protein
VANQAKETEASDTRTLARGYSSLSPHEDKNEGTWRRIDGDEDLELSVIENDADCEAINEDLILEEIKVRQLLIPFHNRFCYLMISASHLLGCCLFPVFHVFLLLNIFHSTILLLRFLGL